MRQDSLDPRSDVDLDVVERYFSNTLSPADRAEFEHSLAASPARRRIVTELRTLWDAHAAAADPWSTEVMWQRIVARTGLGGNGVTAEAAHENGATAHRSTPRPDRAIPMGRLAMDQRAVHGRTTRGLWAGAVLAIALCAIGLWSWTGRSIASHQAVASAGHWKTYVAPRGQRTSIQLQDGTKIVLAADSRLRVRQDPAATRDVELSGEAYFDVHHDGAIPFVVHTAQGIITELGTAFSVRAYPADSEARVVVTSGRVRLTPIVIVGSMDTAIALEPGHVRGTTPGAGTRDKPTTGFASAIVLAAGDMARLDQHGVLDVNHNVDVQAYTAWLTGELRFVRTPLSTVVQGLERWYDVKVHLGDASFAKYMLTVSVRDGSVDDAMDVVTKTLGLRYEKRDGEVWILGQNSH